MIKLLKRFLTGSPQPRSAQPAAGQPTLPAAGQPSARQTSAFVPAPEVRLAEGEDSVSIPFDRCLQNLPPNLRRHIVQVADSGAMLQLPRKFVHNQLPTGKVQLRFGDLKAISPAPIFSPDGSEDATPVNLPLGPILEAAGPAAIARRSGQREITVEDSMPSMFGPSDGPGPERSMAPALMDDPSEQEPAFEPRPSPSTPPATPPTAETPIAMPPPPRAPPSQATETAETLNFPLRDLAAAWPDEIKQVIESKAPPEIEVHLPVAELEPKLKKGKVSFRWSELAAWLRPTVPDATSLLPEGIDLVIPLNLVAPKFMARAKPSTGATAVAVNEKIPVLFQPQAQPSKAPAAPAPAEPSTQDQPRLETSRSPQDFLDQVCSRPGVAGAALSTADGLSIADRLPPQWRSEKWAAFTPQMFAKLTQYGQELQFPSPKSITVTFDETPVFLIKTSAFFLAVIGRPRETMPGAEIFHMSEEFARPKNPA